MFERIRAWLPKPVDRLAGVLIYDVPKYHIPAIYRRVMWDDTSQAGEVTVCRRLMQRDWPRYVVDVGAGDGLHLSNSFPFIQAGWKGVLVEPHPANFGRIRGRFGGNSRVKCVQKACSNVAGRLPLFLEKGKERAGGVSATLSREENEFMALVRSEKSVEVSVETLTTILTECGAPRDFSILTIDAEGLDCEVLEGLDDRRFRPRLIITERYLQDMAKHARKHAMLESRGYVNTGLVGFNTIWIAREFQRTGSPCGYAWRPGRRLV